MAIGKVISIFLIDGVPNGRLAGEILNWTGKALKIPRKQLKISSDRSELSSTGVYFLFGKSEEEPEENAVYIGEAEDVYKRLLQHQKTDFWNEAVVFTSKDENLNKAHVKYLEAKLYKLAIGAKRYRVINQTIPTTPSLSESEQAVLSEYLSNLRILLNTLGYKVLESLAKHVEKKQDIYFIKGARGAKGRAVVTNEGIVVLEGSEVATTTVPSYTDSLMELRNRLIEDGIIKDKKGRLVFSRDHLFSSPSTASAIVIGRTANGRIEMKDKEGRTLKEKEEITDET